MSARDDYPILVAWARGMTLEGFNGDFAEVAVLLALDEIDRLRAELTVANNRLGNAVGALIDAGMYCTGVDDVTAGIDRLRAEREAWEAFRQTVNCPTCDGERWVFTDVHGDSARCPDCTDGKIDMARLLAVGAAVFAEPRGTTAEYRQGHNQLLDRLRQVRP